MTQEGPGGPGNRYAKISAVCFFIVGAALAAAAVYLFWMGGAMLTSLAGTAGDGESASRNLFIVLLLFGLVPLMIFAAGILSGACAGLSIAMGVCIRRQKRGRTLQILSCLVLAAQVLTLARNLTSGWAVAIPGAFSAASAGLFAWFCFLSDEQTMTDRIWIVRRFWFAPAALLAAGLVITAAMNFFFPGPIERESAVSQAGREYGLTAGAFYVVLAFFAVLTAAVFFACLWMREAARGERSSSNER